MTGWLLYYREDFYKNQRFIQFIREGFEKYNIYIRVVILEDENVEEIFQKEQPDFVINRSRNTSIAELFEKMGIRVFNTSKVTEIANDKEKTYRFLKGIVPYMPLLSEEEAQNRKEPYIIKSCGGHGGSQVFLVKNEEQKKQAINAMEGENYLLQKCCSDVGKDVRVYIIGNRIIQTMLRTSTESFKSNYSLGGGAEVYELSKNEIRMVYKILEKLPLDYGGIDFIFHKGKAVFNEVEDAVGARMIYENTDIDIVKMFVEYIIKELNVQ